MATVMGHQNRDEAASMKVVWSRRALSHLVALRNFIAKDSDDSAVQIAMRIVHAVDFLANQPDMGRPGRLPGTRELVVPRTPYVIPYRVRGERLELIAVFHGSQNWPDKL